MSKEILLPIGLPGCGKSTLLNQLLQGRKATVISMDEIRQELTGNMSDISQDTLVRKTAYDRFEKALQTPDSQTEVIAWDAVSLAPSSRKQVISRIQKLAQQAVLKVYEFQLTADQAIQRQTNRVRQVAPQIIRNLAKFYTPFSKQEAQGLSYAHHWVLSDGSINLKDEKIA